MDICLKRWQRFTYLCQNVILLFVYNPATSPTTRDVRLPVLISPLALYLMDKSAEENNSPLRQHFCERENPRQRGLD